MIGERILFVCFSDTDRNLLVHIAACIWAASSETILKANCGIVYFSGLSTMYSYIGHVDLPYFALEVTYGYPETVLTSFDGSPVS